MDWGIALKANVFTWARIQLTALYLLIITVIVFLFSVLFYYTILDAIQANLAQTLADPLFKALIIEDVSNRAWNLIIVGDGLILSIAATLSYFLAGKTLRPIQTAVHLQRQFTADASHELRTPLTILKTDMEVALRQTEFQPEKIRALLRSDLEEVNRLARLAEQLLLVLKNDGLFSPNNATEIVLATVTDHVVQKFQVLAKEKQIHLTLHQKDMGTMLGTIHQVEAIILNLLQNALDYTPAHGSVHVAVQAEPTLLRLTVRDTGIGIASEDLPHLFQRFYKADKARNYKIGGAGLGLAIVHNLVQQHHGKITIQSTAGVGTTVTVLFPKHMNKN